MGQVWSPAVLIAIEGADGCGKTTQVELLRERCEREGLQSRLVSFPRYDDPLFGEPIKRLLRGDLGDVESIDPRLVALLFAGDRGGEAASLRRSLDEGRVVLCDRYFYSNLAYQSARLADDGEVAEFGVWLRELEYGFYAIPAPDCSIYLDVPEQERRRRLAARGGEGGASANDVYERDGDLQARVEARFRGYAETNDDLLRVDGGMLDPGAVHELIWEALRSRGLV
jgi:dTMP kinase